MNAHVDTFNEPPVAVLLGVFRQTAIPRCQHGKDVSLRGATKWRRGNLNLAVLSPFRGVGRLCLSVIRHAQPHMDKCNDLRLSCIHTKNGMIPC